MTLLVLEIFCCNAVGQLQSAMKASAYRVSGELPFFRFSASILTYANDCTAFTNLVFFETKRSSLSPAAAKSSQ
jgi:hypothetical protein